MHKVLFTGDRDWDDRKAVSSILKELTHNHAPLHILLITGGARGLDTIAEEEAEKQGIHVARINALWDSYNNAAGPIRNAIMLNLKPDEVIAFHPNLEHSKGTKNCVQQARKRDIPVRSYRL